MPRPTPTPTPTAPTITAWHTVTYVSETATTITYDSNGTPLVVPKNKLLGTLRHVETVLETVLQEDTDGNYYPFYRIA